MSVKEDLQVLTARLVAEGECLVFTGSRTNQGYGRVRMGGRNYSAHRLIWEFSVGPIPPGLCVLHRCDNPPCCKVEHLFLGTVADNNADRAAKGRNGPGPWQMTRQPTGEHHWSAKLSAAQVAELRHRRAAGETLVDLAAAFGVHHATVSRIARGIWRSEVAA